MANRLVHVSVAHQIVPTLMELGGSPADVFHRLPFAAEASPRPDAAVLLDDLMDLMSDAARATGRPDFGLLVGQRMRVSKLGALGRRLLFARDMDDVFSVLAQHTGNFQHGSKVTRRRVGKRTMLCIDIEATDAERASQLIEAELMTLTGYLRSAYRADWAPSCVYLRRPRPNCPRAFEDGFGAPVAFGQPVDALALDERLMRALFKGHDPYLCDILDGQLRTRLRLATKPEDLTRRIFAILNSSLEPRDVNLPAVAERLGMSARTLQRKLSDDGICYTDMLDGKRKEVAVQLLRHSDLPIAQVALKLGFAEVSSFNRAFNRWADTTPGRYRRDFKRLKGLKAEGPATPTVMAGATSATASYL